MKLFKSSKSAFTLQEILISIAVMAVISVFVMPVMKSIGVNKNKLGIKKANQTLHEVIQNMVNDGTAYSGDNDFSDTTEVILADELGNAIHADGVNKFSEVFYSKLRVSKYSSRQDEGLDWEPCEILLAHGVTNKEGRCYRTEDNIVWGVPATDFKDYNVIKVNNNGYQVTYVPITVYPSFSPQKMAEEENYFENNAVFFAVRQDGDIRIVPQIDCEESQNEVKLQCKAIDYIAETSI